eukprot:COSAG01_NODE_3828_length_5655_cov_3.721742_11_plen_316_part_00
MTHIFRPAGQSGGGGCCEGAPRHAMTASASFSCVAAHSLQLAVLLLLWRSHLCVGEEDGGAAAPIPLQPYQNISTIFSVAVVSEPTVPVGCESFLDYHVARLQLGESHSVALQITAPEPISTYTVSPLARRVPATVDGRILEIHVAAAPAYLIIRVNRLPMLLLLIDRPIAAPDNPISVLSFHADPSGQRDATAAVQAAIDEAASRGLAVLVPPGTFLLTAPLQLRSGSHVHVRPGGVLRSTPDLGTLAPSWARSNLSACPKLPPVLQGGGDGPLPPPQNVLLEGLGTVDASGFALMRRSPSGTCLPSGQVGQNG